MTFVSANSNCRVADVAAGSPEPCQASIFPSNGTLQNHPGVLPMQPDHRRGNLLGRALTSLSIFARRVAIALDGQGGRWKVAYSRAAKFLLTGNMRSARLCCSLTLDGSARAPRGRCPAASRSTARHVCPDFNGVERLRASLILQARDAGDRTHRRRLLGSHAPATGCPTLGLPVRNSKSGNCLRLSRKQTHSVLLQTNPAKPRFPPFGHSRQWGLRIARAIRTQACMSLAPLR